MNSDDNIQVWDDIFQSNEWGKYPALAVVRFIARNFYSHSLSDRKNIKILEVGSGTGANLWFCAREGFSVYALDGSKNAVERMNDRFHIDKLDGQLIKSLVGDYHDTLDSIENNSIDAVIDVESLCCNKYSRTKSTIEKVFTKLKVGGKFLSVTFSDGSYGLVGEEIDIHTVLPKDGPAAGKGFVRYTTESDIQDLYKLPNNEIESIEREELHLNNSEVIKEWNIIAVKTQ
jgi:SAM-dependent methyltransferase